MSKPPSKPAASAAAPDKGAKPAASAKAAEKAKPDAALLDREVDDGADEIVAPTTLRTGFRRFLPAGKLGWTIAASVLVTVIGGAATAAFFLMPPKATPALSHIAGPAQVVNGRMLVVAGQTIRLQDIDAPPAELVCRDGVWEYKCGADSRKALEQFIANRPVDCEPAYAADGVVHALCRSEQGVDVAAALVASGWAVADLRRSSRYFPQQVKAQDQGLGLWRNNFAHPEQWRLAAQGTR